MIIDSKIKYLDPIKDNWSQDIVKNEPMLFNCDYRFARINGGPITHDILDKLPFGWKEPGQRLVIDSRVHMLMPGWFPCIPGFHHDDVPRSRSDGQPNYHTPEYRSEHLMALVNGSICPTEFALGDGIFIDAPLGEIIYKKWHLEVEERINYGILYRHKVDSGKLIWFNDRSWHQGTKAIRAGWRFFIRISRNTDRVKTITNEIRRQAQVYLEAPMEGW